MRLLLLGNMFRFSYMLRQSRRERDVVDDCVKLTDGCQEMSCDGSFRERDHGGTVLMRILVVEDDPHIGPSLKKGLEGNRYAVDLVRDGREALFMGLAVPYDLLILDVRLPQLSGFEVCHQLRDHGRKMPILLLTALGEVEHRIK